MISVSLVITHKLYLKKIFTISKKNVYHSGRNIKKLLNLNLLGYDSTGKGFAL